MDYSQLAQIGDIKIIKPLKKNKHDWHAATFRDSDCVVLTTQDDSVSLHEMQVVQRGVSPAADDARRTLLNQIAWHGRGQGRVIVRRNKHSGSCYCYTIDDDFKVKRARMHEERAKTLLNVHFDQQQLPGLDVLVNANGRSVVANTMILN